MESTIAPRSFVWEWNPRFDFWTRLSFRFIFLASTTHYDKKRSWKSPMQIHVSFTSMCPTHSYWIAIFLSIRKMENRENRESFLGSHCRNFVVQSNPSPSLLALGPIPKNIWLPEEVNSTFSFCPIFPPRLDVTRSLTPRKRKLGYEIWIGPRSWADSPEAKCVYYELDFPPGLC